MPEKRIQQIGLWGVSFSLIAAVTFCCGQANASAMRAYAMEDLVFESELVVIGSAVQIESRKNARGKIVRQVSFRVEEYVIGKGPSTIVLQLLGGTIGSVRSHVIGALDLALNDTVLLFVKGSPDPKQNIHYVVGMSQGCFRMVKDAQTGKRLVTQVLDGRLHLVDEVGGDPMGIGRSGICICVSLERFVSRIRKLKGITEAQSGER